MPSIDSSTNFTNQKEIVLLAMSLAQRAVGVRAHRTAKSLAKLVVALNATKADALDLNRENVVTFSVLPDVLVPNNPTVW